MIFRSPNAWGMKADPGAGNLPGGQCFGGADLGRINPEGGAQGDYNANVTAIHSVLSFGNMRLAA